MTCDKIFWHDDLELKVNFYIFLYWPGIRYFRFYTLPLPMCFFDTHIKDHMRSVLLCAITYYKKGRTQQDKMWPRHVIFHSETTDPIAVVEPLLTTDSSVYPWDPEFGL